MSISERASISGTALSYLLNECVSANSTQEGFLLGNVTREVTNHISDSQQENALTEVIVDITSTLPGPDTGLFYSSSGKINETAITDMLMEAAPKVVGWYKYRRNNSLKPTLRDKIVSRGLQKYFEKQNCKFFMCCNVTCEQSSGNATHSLSYRFSKVDQNGDLELLQDSTSNLGENVSSYKRPMKGGRNDPFSLAARNASGKSIPEVAVAVGKALSTAAAEAVQHEIAIRAVSREINQMLQLLSDYYQTNSCILNPEEDTSSRIQKENEILQPLINSLKAPAPEPFDFVNDLIKNDLKQCSTEHKSNLLSINESCPTLNVKTDGKISGHKRIHSEGAVQSSDVLEKGRSSTSKEWEPRVNLQKTDNA